MNGFGSSRPGRGDVIVGYQGSDAYYTNGGVVLVYLGPLSGALGPGDADFTLVGAAAYDQLGWSVAAGDLNADGIDDLAVGSYSYAGDVAGAGLVVLGSGL